LIASDRDEHDDECDPADYAGDSLSDTERVDTKNALIDVPISRGSGRLDRSWF
jgi:hypothetical protein